MRIAGTALGPAGWLGLTAGLGLLGAACDQIHVQSGLLAYPDPLLWDQAAWVPLNFAVLLTALVVVSRPVALVAAARGLPAPSAGLLAADLAWFVGAYGLSGLVGPDAPATLAVIYAAVWLPRVLLRPERGLLVPYGLALALAGCTVEAVEIELGLFAYSDPDVAGVPWWLAGIYLHGAPLALDVVRRVHPVSAATR